MEDLQINSEDEKSGCCVFVTDIIVNLTFGVDVYPDLYHFHLSRDIINNFPCLL